MRKGGLLAVVLVPFLLATALSLAISMKAGIARPMSSDAFYYLGLAKSLAAGQGYVAHEGFWPDAPTMGRSPGWPFVVSLALRVVRGVSPDLVMRLSGILFHGAVAALVAVLAWRAFGRRSAALLAGAAYAVHPAALFFVISGDSEVFFLVLALGGVLLAMGRGWRRLAGVAILGLACLVRAYFILWIGFAVGFQLMRLWVNRRPVSARGLAALAAGVALFVLPPFLWAARNYRICHHFPVFSTLKGEVFYGGNNPVVSENLLYWGYWVFPNEIPGETPKVDLARTRTEYELDNYYDRKGKEWLAQNPSAIPRLTLGKLVRAYVPIPWKPNWGSYAVSAFRWLLYAAALVGACRCWRRAPFAYVAATAAVVLTDVVTVALFWGCARFAFVIEPFLLPFAAMGLLEIGRIAAWFWRRGCEPVTA